MPFRPVDPLHNFLERARLNKNQKIYIQTMIPCTVHTVVLYDKGGTIQRAGCLVTGCQIKVASRSCTVYIVLANATRGNAK